MEFDSFPREIRGEIFQYFTKIKEIYPLLLVSKEFNDYVHMHIILLESDTFIHLPDGWITKFTGLYELGIGVIAHLSVGLLPPRLKIGTVMLGPDEELRDLGLKGGGWDLRLLNDKETRALIIQGNKYYGDGRVTIENLENVDLSDGCILINSIFAEYLQEIVLPSFGYVMTTPFVDQSSKVVLVILQDEIKKYIGSRILHTEKLQMILIPHFQFMSVDPLLAEKAYGLLEKFVKVNRKTHLGFAIAECMKTTAKNIHTYKIM